MHPSPATKSPNHDPFYGPGPSLSEEQYTHNETIAQVQANQRYRTILYKVCMVAIAEALLFLLLDKHKFVDTIIWVLFFIPYPFWFSRIGVLVPVIASPPFETKILVILVLLFLHGISRYESHDKSDER